MTLSKLINKTEENFDKEFHHEGLSSSPKSNGKFTDKDAYYRVKSFLTKCIQESYETGRKEAYMAGFGDGYDKGREEILNLQTMKDEVIDRHTISQCIDIEKINEGNISAREIVEGIGESFNQRNALRNQIRLEIKSLTNKSKENK